MSTSQLHARADFFIGFGWHSDPVQLRLCCMDSLSRSHALGNFLGITKQHVLGLRAEQNLCMFLPFVIERVSLRTWAWRALGATPGSGRKQWTIKDGIPYHAPTLSDEVKALVRSARQEHKTG